VIVGLGLLLGFAASDEPSEFASKLKQGLAASDCETRWSAVTEYSNYVRDEATDPLAALRRVASSSVGQLRPKLLMLVEYTQQTKAAHGRASQLSNEVSAAASARDPKARHDRLIRMRERVESAIRAPKEDFVSRITIASLMARAARTTAGRAAGWDAALDRLLSDSDPRVRRVGAFLAANRTLLKTQEPDFSSVVPALIDGLLAPSFAERFYSQGGLIAATASSSPQLCVDPTDPPDAIRTTHVRWKAWWANNAPQLGPQKISQLY